MKRALFGCLWAVMALGCGGTSDGTACPAIAASNFTVTVTDAVTSARICDATVSATDSSTGGSMNLMVFGGATDCAYSGGFYERPGTFTLTAQKSGYLPTTMPNVVVTKGVCNVTPAQVTLKLGK
ncbi:MAG TPA: carboxypeptidase-like regulatory domain-containing protein [Pseudomonadota bacterium]|nr:carboxypeptidase-like regulatory domain-containing protein [Pseudomonadota bacterium]